LNRSLRQLQGTGGGGDYAAAISTRSAACCLRGAGRSSAPATTWAIWAACSTTATIQIRSDTVERIASLPTPVVAAVHAIADGRLGAALAADIIICAENARFRDTHGKVGLVRCGA